MGRIKAPNLSLTTERQIMNAYKEHGYDSRKAYLIGLAQEMEIDRSTVFMMADLLGEGEDFDGLVTSLEDYAEGF